MHKAPLQQIIAIGGGGFSRYGAYTPDNFRIEQYLLEQTGKERPSICFIPTASGESHKYIIDFYREFGRFECKPSHLSLFDLPTNNLESYLLQKDAIYVGGGNTKSMLALWREWHLDRILAKALEAGVVLSGISAGANCWFEECVTDSIPGALTALPCLGFLKGSCCPHYDGEVNRKPSYHKLIEQGKLSNGTAIDDHAAVHYVNGEVKTIFRAKPTASAYRVYKNENGVKEASLI